MTLHNCQIVSKRKTRVPNITLERVKRLVLTKLIVCIWLFIPYKRLVVIKTIICIWLFFKVLIYVSPSK
jgi:hypothetical protein